MRELFKNIHDFLADFGDSSRHQLRIFWFSLIFCAALDLTAGFVVAIIFTMAVAPLLEVAHTFCERKRIKVLWFRTDIPNIVGLKDEVKKGEVTRHRSFEPKNVNYAIAALLTYYVVKLVVLGGMATYNLT